MGKSRTCTTTDGKLSCKVEGEDIKKEKSGPLGRFKRYGARKVVTMTEKTGEVKPGKVEASGRVVETDALKGKVFDGAAKDYKGTVSEEFSDKTYDTGQEGKSAAKVKTTEYYKDRRFLGRKLTGEATKKLGGRIETEEGGKKTVITYKGADKKARVSTSDKPVTERYKKRYDEDTEKAEKSGKGIDEGEKKSLQSLVYFKSLNPGGTEKDYKLGSRLPSDREIMVDKKAAKSKKGEDSYRQKKSKSKKLRQDMFRKMTTNG